MNNNVFDKRSGEYFKSFNRRVVMSNSFFGLDQSVSIPPNLILTGPLTKPAGDLMEQF